MRRPRLALVIPLVVGSAFAAASTAHAAAPANDAFADRTVITLDFAETVDTTDATVEPADFAAQAACNSPEPAATVWYELTVDERTWVAVSSAPPTYSSGFNILAPDGAGGFQCIDGGPVEVLFVAEAGVVHYIQSIDDQFDGGGNGGTLNFSATSLGPTGDELCPGLFENEPRLPPLPFNVIVGTDGDDVLTGTPGPDLIYGRDGNDTIHGLDGDDFIFGCDGDDDISAGAGNDFVIGDSADFFGNPTSRSGGDDTVSGGPGDDEIRGGPGNDDLSGNSGDDGVFGNQGDDTVNGNHGSDFLGGGFGNDIVNGGHGDDGVTGGPGDDILNGGQGDDFITGDFPNGMPDPTPNTDTCNGAQGDDFILFCEAGNGK